MAFGERSAHPTAAKRQAYPDESEKMRYKFIAGFISALLLSNVGGCKQAETTRGVVTMDGRPVAGASVVFSPIVFGRGIGLSGVTDENGRFTIKPFVPSEIHEPIVGEYIVAITKTETTEASGSMVVRGSPTVEVRIRHLLPEAYSDRTTSPLRATVSDGLESFEFDLDSRIKAPAPLMKR